MSCAEHRNTVSRQTLEEAVLQQKWRAFQSRKPYNYRPRVADCCFCLSAKNSGNRTRNPYITSTPSTEAMLDQENPEPLSVAIIGAGIGGLVCAIACRRQGLQVTVLEQAHEIKAVRSSIPTSFPPDKHACAATSLTLKVC